MDGKTLNKLYVISFLDSFCTAVTLPVLNNYIVVGLKGSHFLLGMLSMLHILSQIIMSPLLNPVTKFAGARNLLIFSHVVTFLNYLIVIIANDYHLFLLFRVPFFIFNQTSYLSELLIARDQSKRKNPTGDKFLGQLTTAAYIVGPFCGGLLYHDNSILCVASMLNILTTLSLVLAYKLPVDGNLSAKIKYTRPLISNIWPNTWLEYWHSKSTLSNVKILTTIGLTCFFIKFTLIMGANFNASPSLIGFTISLHNLIFFSARFSCRLVDNTMRRIHSQFRNMLLCCIMLMTSAMYALCTTSDYGTYLVCFVILALSREMFERLWSIETDAKAQNEVESLLKSVTCFLPVVLGACCDMYSHVAVQIMSLVPLVLATFFGIMKFQQNQVHSKMKQVKHEIMKSFDVVDNKKLN